MKLGKYELNHIYTGDAKFLSEAIPDNSVDLIFTDPVYQRIDDYRWLAETAARVLKDDRACLMWQGQQWLEETIIVLHDSPLAYRWLLGWYASNNMQMVGTIGRKYVPLLRYEKGRAKPRPHRDLWDAPLRTGHGAFNHRWSKRPEPILHWIKAFTKTGGIVLDPFTGGGTVPAACKMLGRNYLAFEIDPATADLARERVANTQPPLFVPKPKQAKMAI